MRTETSTEYAAAKHLLTADLFAGLLEPYISDHDFDWEQIRGSRAWSTSELILIDTAWEMWRGSSTLWDGGVTSSSLASIIRNLDENNFERVIAALRIRRDKTCDVHVQIPDAVERIFEAAEVYKVLHDLLCRLADHRTGVS